MKKYVLYLSIYALLLASCSHKEEANTANPNAMNPTFLSSVKTVKATLSNQEEELVLTGKVEYNPDRVIYYTSLVSGIVERSYFSLGDKVQKGQTLLDLRSADLSALQSEYINAETELKVAQRDLQSVKSLFEDGMLSEKDLLEAQVKLQQAEGVSAKAKADISTFGTNKGNGTFAIKSPIAGYIVDKKVSTGSTVSGDGDPLFVVADLSEVWVIANVYASNLQFVKEGMEVELTTLSYPNEVFKGKIASLSQVFDPEEKVLKARIVMPNQNMKLKPEMSAVIHLKNESHRRLVAIPSDALVFDNDRYFVVVERSTHDFEIKEVKLQGHNRATSYISSGIQEGEQVVVNNQLLIYTGLNEQ